jgi:hypothetical protein
MTSWYGQANRLKINQIKNCHMTFIILIILIIKFKINSKIIIYILNKYVIYIHMANIDIHHYGSLGNAFIKKIKSIAFAIQSPHLI